MITVFVTSKNNVVFCAPLKSGYEASSEEIIEAFLGPDVKDGNRIRNIKIVTHDDPKNPLEFTELVEAECKNRKVLSTQTFSSREEFWTSVDSVEMNDFNYIQEYIGDGGGRKIKPTKSFLDTMARILVGLHGADKPISSMYPMSITSDNNLRAWNDWFVEEYGEGDLIDMEYDDIRALIYSHSQEKTHAEFMAGVSYELTRRYHSGKSVDNTQKINAQHAIAQQLVGSKSYGADMLNGNLNYMDLYSSLWLEKSVSYKDVVKYFAELFDESNLILNQSGVSAAQEIAHRLSVDIDARNDIRKELQSEEAEKITAKMPLTVFVEMFNQNYSTSSGHITLEILDGIVNIAAGYVYGTSANLTTIQKTRLRNVCVLYLQERDNWTGIEITASEIDRVFTDDQKNNLAFPIICSKGTDAANIKSEIFNQISTYYNLSGINHADFVLYDNEYAIINKWVILALSRKELEMKFERLGISASKIHKLVANDYTVVDFYNNYRNIAAQNSTLNLNGQAVADLKNAIKISIGIFDDNLALTEKIVNAYLNLLLKFTNIAVTTEDLEVAILESLGIDYEAAIIAAGKWSNGLFKFNVPVYTTFSPETPNAPINVTTSLPRITGNKFMWALEWTPIPYDEHEDDPNEITFMVQKVSMSDGVDDTPWNTWLSDQIYITVDNENGRWWVHSDSEKAYAILVELPKNQVQFTGIIGETHGLGAEISALFPDDLSKTRKPVIDNSMADNAANALEWKGDVVFVAHNGESFKMWNELPTVSGDDYLWSCLKMKVSYVQDGNKIVDVEEFNVNEMYKGKKLHDKVGSDVEIILEPNGVWKIPSEYHSDDFVQRFCVTDVGSMNGDLKLVGTVGDSTILGQMLAAEGYGEIAGISAVSKVNNIQNSLASRLREGESLYSYYTGGSHKIFTELPVDHTLDEEDYAYATEFQCLSVNKKYGEIDVLVSEYNVNPIQENEELHEEVTDTRIILNINTKTGVWTIDENQEFDDIVERLANGSLSGTIGDTTLLGQMLAGNINGIPNITGTSKTSPNANKSLINVIKPGQILYGYSTDETYVSEELPTFDGEPNDWFLAIEFDCKSDNRGVKLLEICEYNFNRNSAHYDHHELLTNQDNFMRLTVDTKTGNYEIDEMSIDTDIFDRLADSELTGNIWESSSILAERLTCSNWG